MVLKRMKSKGGERERGGGGQESGFISTFPYMSRSYMDCVNKNKIESLNNYIKNRASCIAYLLKRLKCK